MPYDRASLPATFINSSIAPAEQRERIEALRRGQFKLVYVAPERFRSSNFVAAIQSIGVSLFAVDEAHCISTWGHDFRPDYLRLKSALQSLGAVQTLALTATATPYVRSDIIEQLGLSNPETFVSGFDRPNLSIDVVQTETEREKVARIKRLARTHDGSGIVYASTRKAVEHVARELQEQGLQVASYHAGMGDSMRIKAQENFMSGRTANHRSYQRFWDGHRQIGHQIRCPLSDARIDRSLLSGDRACRTRWSAIHPASCYSITRTRTRTTFSSKALIQASNLCKAFTTLSGQPVLSGSNSPLLRSESGAGASNDMAVQSSLYLLERAGHIQRVAAVQCEPSGLTRRWNGRHRSLSTSRSPHHHARQRSARDFESTLPMLSRRAALERRKLREMIDFCYTEHCYRAHILDYFGDRHHARQCGTCGNCAPNSAVRGPLTSAEALNPLSCVSPHGKTRTALVETTLRALSVDETLRVRKILAGAKRMKGRFGKNVLAATLRGSAAKNVMQSHLNELSTYGLLKDMRQDDILIYVDALIQARCLRVNPGEYPTVSITDLGDRVMREQEQIELSLPAISSSGQFDTSNQVSNDESVTTNTMRETYSLYQRGLSAEEIASERGCTKGTIEGHLIECLRAGLAIDIGQFVSSDQRLLIEKAIAKHGAESLNLFTIHCLRTSPTT